MLSILAWRWVVNWGYLVITQKSPRRRESGLLDACARQILRCAQDDKTSGCHPERSEGSLADFWVITRGYTPMGCNDVTTTIGGQGDPSGGRPRGSPAGSWGPCGCTAGHGAA